MSGRKRVKTKKATGEDAPEKTATSFGKPNMGQQKVWPIDSMDVNLTEDGVLSYTIQWKPTTFTCKSKLRKHEQKRLEELVTAKYGLDRWASWLSSLEGESV
jgi:hypothetical protein